MVIVNLSERNAKSQALPPSGTLVAALDIGTTKIACLIAQLLPAKNNAGDLRSRVRVIGFGHTASRGVRAGAITDVVEAERAIRLAVDAAEKMAQRSITDIYVNVSGGRPISTFHSSSAKLQNGIVTKRDVDAAISSALNGLSIGKRRVLHLSPISFSLDGVETSDAPFGLSGETLSVKLGLVTVDPAHLRNLTAAIERAHLFPAGFVVAPYSAARATLVDDELKLGSIVIDMGGAVTSVGVFQAGHLIAADTISIGGQLVTHDIAQGLSTTIAHAERLKTLYGNVLTYGNDEKEMLSVPRLGEQGVDGVERIPKSALTSIIRPRMEEILELTGAKLKAFGTLVPQTAHVVLTGGGAAMPGVRELARAVLGRETRIAQAPHLSSLPDQVRQPAFAVTAGLLCYAVKPDRHYALPAEAVAAIEHQQMGYVRRIGRWLADSF